MAGGAWKRGWRALRQASPNCSFIPQMHGVLRHPWGAPTMEPSDTLGVLPSCSSQTPSGYCPQSVPSQTFCPWPPETAAFTPTLPAFLLRHGASFLSWPYVLEPSLSHCLLGTSPSLIPPPHPLLPSSCHLFTTPPLTGVDLLLVSVTQGLTVLLFSMSQGLTVLPTSLS